MGRKGKNQVQSVTIQQYFFILFQCSVTECITRLLQIYTTLSQSPMEQLTLSTSTKSKMSVCYIAVNKKLPFIDYCKDYLNWKQKNALVNHYFVLLLPFCYFFLFATLSFRYFVFLPLCHGSTIKLQPSTRNSFKINYLTFC